MIVSYIKSFFDMLKKSDDLTAEITIDKYVRYHSNVTNMDVCVQDINVPSTTDDSDSFKCLAVYVNNFFDFRVQRAQIPEIVDKEAALEILLSLVVNGIDKDKPIRVLLQEFEAVFGFANYSFSYKVDKKYLQSEYWSSVGDFTFQTSVTELEYDDVFADFNFYYNLGVLTYNELINFSVDSLLKMINTTNTGGVYDYRKVKKYKFFKPEESGYLAKLMMMKKYIKFDFNDIILYAFSDEDC